MIRKVNLAKEANQMIELLSKVFQYPDHPEWNASEDLIKEVQQRARAYKRMAPILNLFPSYKNRIQGLVYDVNNKAIGLSIFFETSPKKWHIDYIGVLATHRGQGLGEALVDATLERIRDFSGKYVSLMVADGNTPAERLYKKAGFEHITQRLVMEMERGKTVPDTSVATDYQLDVVTKKNWEAQYTIAKVVVPSTIAFHQPITPDLYKPGRFALLSKALNRLAGREFKTVSLKEQGDLVGWALLNISKKGQDVNAIEIMTVEDQSVADYLLTHSLKMMTEANSAPTTIVLDSWQTSLIKAASPFLKIKKVSNSLGRAL